MDRVHANLMLASLTRADNETSPLQNPQVPRHSRLRHVVWCRQRADVGLTSSELLDHQVFQHFSITRFEQRLLNTDIQNLLVPAGFDRHHASTCLSLNTQLPQLLLHFAHPTLKLLGLFPNRSEIS